MKAISRCYLTLLDLSLAFEVSEPECSLLAPHLSFWLMRWFNPAVDPRENCLTFCLF